MTPSGYSEDELIEQPAIVLFDEIGWKTFNAYDEFDHTSSPLGRETKAEVILKDRLNLSLQRLNPTLPQAALDLAIEELTRDRSRLSFAAANREIFNLLKNGVRVSIPDPENDGQTVELINVIEWNDSAQNDFLVCSQFWVTGEMYTRRADLVGFVNGFPLLFIELKAAHCRLETAFTGNLRDYKDTIPHLFWPNAIIILSNGSQSRVGSITAGWEHFAEWKKIEDENEQGVVSLETMLRGICRPDRFLDIVENFTIFQEVQGGLIKLIAKNHQYLGVNNSIQALQKIQQTGDGKLGVFWHTQGSGKSVSMIYFAQKVLRKIPGNWTFVIVTDRQELDGQIYKNFTAAGVVSENHAQAESSAHLRQLLTEDHRYVFTLIHKFRTEQGQVHPVLSERKDIIVITDEAHRSQYDTLALNMRTALPKASFMAFTGTPLIVGEEKTRDVFGDYVSIYNFQQSVADGATVPLYYENRIPQLQLTNQSLNQDMERLLEDAELDEAQEKRIEQEFSREYHLITREDRLEAIADDLVNHFIGRGFQGKGMMICIDKATAVKMYNKVQSHWSQKITQLQADLAIAPNKKKSDIQQKIDWMKKTDMAVVVSQGQNEIADMQDKGLDIRPHRRRMIEEDLETKFKNPDDPFRLVFVCAMWMTGFDVPSCSTLYLDKPMRNHTLMQTIARANRVYPGKVSGLIVDYAGVFRNLEAALAVYGAGKGGDNPVEDKSALIAALGDSIQEVKDLFLTHDVDLKAIQNANGFTRVALLDQAVENLIATEELKRRYLDLTNTVNLLYKAILPDPAAHQFLTDAAPIKVIAEKIRALTPAADISFIMQQVEELLDQSIATEGYVISDPLTKEGELNLIDLSDVDFDDLAKKFKQGKKRTINEKLKGAIAQKLIKMVRLNRTRMNFMEKFQAMIDEYNAGSLNAEEFFRRLRDFSQELEQEDKRTISENLSEEELTLFDLLTKPDIELSNSDRQKVKLAAKELLYTLKTEKIVLDWRKRQQTRADVRITIEKILDERLPVTYTTELFEQKSIAIFQHIYDAYPSLDKNIYI